MAGRPRDSESERRATEFRARLLAGESWADARRHSGIAASKVVRLLDEEHFRALAVAILDRRVAA